MEPNTEDIFINAINGDFSISVSGPKAKQVYDYMLALLDIPDKKPDAEEVVNSYVKDGYLNKV